jgi:hypothetical protein
MTFGEKYSIKFDGLRKSKQWTAIAPEGRLSDVETEEEAIKLIQDHKDGERTRN